MKKVCSTSECNLPIYALGKCSRCYQRLCYWNDRSIRDKFNHVKKMRRGEALIEELLGNIKAMKRA